MSRKTQKDYTIRMSPAERDALLVLVDQKAERRDAPEMWLDLRAQLLASQEGEAD